MANRKHCDYDVCVVGAGLIGSSTARHLSDMNPKWKLALIGPAECQDRSKTDIHGAWYDEGRITRTLDPDPTWAVLAQRSISNYSDLERKSGIKFFEPVGYMGVGSEGGKLVPLLKQCAEQLCVQVEVLQAADLNRKFPFFNCASHCAAVYSIRDSGYVNPRQLVAAQQVEATRNGCDIIKAVVDRISPLDSSGWLLELEGKRRVTADKVLVAVGAFSGFRSLLPDNVRPDMDLMGTTALRVEVEETELVQFTGMPTIITEGAVDRSPGQRQEEGGSYIMPPIKYPDGKYYLKIGTGWSHAIKMKSRDQMREWYIRGSSPSCQRNLLDTCARLCPGLGMKNYRFDHCVTTSTATGQLYVDILTPNLGVALGGCGLAAKSADEIGCMAARMIAKGEWDYDLPAENFRFRSRSSEPDAKL